MTSSLFFNVTTAAYFLAMVVFILYLTAKSEKIALVATAHYLVRVMLSMFQTGEVWRTESAVA